MSIILETADIDRLDFYIKSDTLSILVTTLRKIFALQELVSRRLPILIHNVHSKKVLITALPVISLEILITSIAYVGIKLSVKIYE